MRREIAENEHGRRVVVKAAETAEEAARLRREADLLDVATHPGLVELLGFDDGAEPVLRTGEIDGPSLEEGGRAYGLEEVAGVVAAVASILADLHGMGLVHGAVAPSHVLVDGDGRPVLCGLGYGGLTGEPVLQRPVLPASFVDPAGVDSGALDPSADVFGVGALILFLLDGLDGRGRAGGGEALRAAARAATATDPASRPTARYLADAAHDAVASPRLPHRDGAAGAPAFRGPDPVDVGGSRPLEGWRRGLAPARSVGRGRRLRTAAAAVFALVSVVGALAVALGGGGGKAAGARSRPVAASPPSTVVVVSTTVPVALTAPVRPSSTVSGPTRSRAAPAGCETTDGPLAADVDGDGCPESLRFGDGVVVAGARRWSVGEVGDEIAVGDWNCSGARSLAVLRPRSGEVFAFAGWAAPGRDIEAPLIGTVAGGRTLRAADVDGDGCNELVVERAAGAPVVMRAPRAGP